MARPMRADARRSVERIVRAARDRITERGPDVPLDEIARAAGVGSGTLYRHFPDREALLHAVALDALISTVGAARSAAAEADPFEALARYLREALKLRVSVVLPALFGTVDLEGDPELAGLRKEAVQIVEGFISAAQEAGSLPSDVTFMDLGTMLARIARPLPGPATADEQYALSERHLELFVRGLSRR